MDLLNDNEIKTILLKCGVVKFTNLKWEIKNYSDKLIGYLGDHLSLTVYYEDNNVTSKMVFFIKSVPRFDEWKKNYVRETAFFSKEYVMLSRLFKHFHENDDRKWRPKLLFIKEDLFVFEDVTILGYIMPSNLNVLSYEELSATVTALARFHAQSIIFEERKSHEFTRPYTIWEEFYKYLCEPPKVKSWRDTGMRAVIDFLKVFSQYTSLPNFTEIIERMIPKLFTSAEKLMKPSSKFRNVVIHRDIWSNNIFLKKQVNGEIHALIVDYQTVLYCPPTLDLSSLIYFNTTKQFRDRYTKIIIDYYYDILNRELKLENIDIKLIIDKKDLEESYQESLVFAITQAALIVPIVTMPDGNRKQSFADPETSYRINCISRSQEIIDLAKENETYRKRVIEIFDELLLTFVYSSVSENSFEI